MTKFRIQTETRQVWQVEVDADTKEEAEKIRDTFYEQIQNTINGIETQFPNPEGPMFECVETFGGDDLSDDDITDLTEEELPEAERASLTAVYTLFTTCPHCGSETEYQDEQPEYAQIMDAINGGTAIITCPDCSGKYRQNSYKEY